MINNIKNNTISEADTKKKINELNKIKKVETKGKRLINSQKTLLSLFDYLKTIFNNNNNESDSENESVNKDENENENKSENESENTSENESENKIENKDDNDNDNESDDDYDSDDDDGQ